MTTPPPSDPPTQPELDDTEHASGSPDGPPGGWAATERGAPAPGAVPGTGRHDGLGTAALVLGIVGIVLAVSVVGGFVLGVVALVFGLLALRRARRGEAANRGEALGGTILGAIAVVLSVAAGVVLLVAGIGPLTSGSPTAAAAPARAQLQQCVQQAHGDKAAVRACRRQFGPPRRPGTAT